MISMLSLMRTFMFTRPFGKSLLCASLLCAPFIIGITDSSIAIGDERSDIPIKYTWNLNDLYPTIQDWETSKDRMFREIPKVAAFKGHLGTSAQNLYQALSTEMDVRKEVARLSVYAGQLSDQDTRVAKHQAMKQITEQLSSDFASATAYFRPEIVQIGKAKISTFLKNEPRLMEYRMYLDNILRMKSHILSPDNEKIIAAALGQMGGSPQNINEILDNADIPFPTIQLSTGETVRLDPAAFTKYRTVANKDDRILVYKSFFGKYKEFARTLGTVLYSQIKVHVFNKEVRKYNSSLAASLDPDNIPEAVYKQLITDVHANLPTLHRYLRLRQKMMGLEKLGYEDLYTSLVKDVSMSFTPEDAIDLTMKSVSLLGNEYTSALDKESIIDGPISIQQPEKDLVPIAMVQLMMFILINC
ncbi:MAG: hypothetical protein HQK53_02665 [Oligoflexia bacterium]|nr:hypothetical protein [Oligoflexia bacterium]